MIVDSHCHAALGWYEPIEVLLRQMDANGVERAILIQIRGQFDNSYQADCVRRYPDRLASVVCVDPGRADAPQELERLAAEGTTGVRLRPGDRSPGDDPLALWRKAAELGLSISSGGSGPEFADDAFAAIFEELPELPIVVEHLGSVNNPREESPESRPVEKVFGLSRYPNAYLKVPGLGEYASRAMPVKDPFPFVEPIPSLLERAYDAFGPTRMMWGSDFPPVSAREGYRNALAFPMERLANKPEAERAQIFGEVAWSIFGTRR